MQFLSPLFWIASISVTVPVLIHLVRRERAQSFFFSSLLYLRPITRKSYKYLKIRNPWVLLLRALFLLLLVLAFARPYLPGAQTARAGLPTSTAMVILLDNSYSMSVGGSFEQAVRATRDAIEGLGEQDEAALIAFSDVFEVLSGLTTDKAVLLGLVEGRAKQSFRTTNYVPALRTADKMLSDRTGKRRTILLISDSQKLGFRQDAAFRLSPGVKLEVKEVGTEKHGLVTVTNSHVDFLDRSRDIRAKVTARLLNFDTSRPDANVDLLLNGRVVDNSTITFGADTVKPAVFENIVWPEGTVRGEVRVKTGDSRSSFYFVADTRVREEVLVVEGPKAVERGGRRSAFYLSRALAADQGNTFAVQTVSLPGAASVSLREFRTIFITGVDNISAGLARRLENAVKAGSGLVIACGPQLSIDTFNSSFGALTPANLVKAVRRDREPVGVLGNLQYNHPVFKVFSDTKTGNFLASRFHGYYEVSLRPGAEVLCRFDDGIPALVERSLGNGRILMFSSSLDKSWNDLPLNPVYLPFVHQLVSYAGLLNTQRNWLWVGDSIVLDDESLGETSQTSRTPSLYVTTPGDKDSEHPLRDPVYTFEEPGFYAFRGHRNLEYRAVNFRPEEIDFTPFDVEEFVAAVTAPVAYDDMEELVSADRESKEHHREFGVYFLTLGLILLVVELAIANRSVRQVL